MALIQTNFFSPTLGFNTDVNIVIPTPNSDEILNRKRSDYFYKGVHFPVLYLLHGAYGDYSDWIRLTSIEKYAQNRRLAVVMPSASNSFYQDMFRGSAYLTYLTEELPRLVQSLFPISRKRENTFVAGLSMGGYGAFRLALTKPESFSCAASLSGALDISTLKDNPKDDSENPFRTASIFEHPEQIEGSDADLFALFSGLQKQGRPLPRLFLSCGTGDFLYPVNLSAKSRLEDLGADLTYEEHAGTHDWDYWDRNIRRVLDWLPIADSPVKK